MRPIYLQGALCAPGTFPDRALVAVAEPVVRIVSVPNTEAGGGGIGHPAPIHARVAIVGSEPAITALIPHVAVLAVTDAAVEVAAVERGARRRFVGLIVFVT